jgi:Phage capsid family
MPNVRGSLPDGPENGAGDRPMTGRKYPMRPIGAGAGRKYPMRPIGAGAGRKYPMRPYEPRQDWPPPQPDKYPMRPYDWRKYPMRPYDEAATLDPDEWTADVSELFCSASAVVRLGARLVYDGDAIPAPDVPLTWQGPTYKPPGRVNPVDNLVAPIKVLRPASHELAVAVPLTNQLTNDLASRPEVAWAMKEDIANALALAADDAFLNGQGPPGLTGVTGAGAGRTGPPGLDPLAKARKMVAQLRGVGQGRAQRPLVPFRSAGWVLDTGALNALVSVQTATGFGAGAGGRGPRSLDDTDLLRYDGHDGGELLGYQFCVSEGARANRMFLGADWGETWIGVCGDIVSVDFDTDAGFAGDGMTVRAIMRHDFLVRRPNGFRWTQ